MKLFEKGELKLLWPFYLNVFFTGILLFLPIFEIVYFMGIGLNMFQISLFSVIASLIQILFEIPTGAIADLYGRKTAIIVGESIYTLSALLILFSNNFYYILLVLALNSFSTTMISGAAESLEIDYIEKKNKDLLPTFLTKEVSIDGLGTVISGIVGGLLVKYFGIKIIWICAALSSMLSIALYQFIKEEFHREEINEELKIEESFKKVVKKSINSLKYLRKHSIVMMFTLASFIIITSSLFTGKYSWIPLLTNLGFKEYQLGYLWSLIGVIDILTPLLSSKIIKDHKERAYLILSSILLVVIIIPILFVKSIAPAIIIYLLIVVYYSTTEPLNTSYFNRFLTKKIRATVTSAQNTILSIPSLVIIPIVGSCVDKFGPRETIFFSAIIMIPAIIILAMIKDNKEEEEKIKKITSSLN